ncbi:hypothetical protein [Tropicimonas sp. S265A]|uniref:hypothetical protein n=1 Tax=Tropicimonas sp. S265A TaxID=3415134 RepID=UPI003C7B85DE
MSRVHLGVVALGLVLSAGFGQAQTPPGNAATDAQNAPILRVEFEEQEAIPGQPLSLRMTVLVPTQLTGPPVWPTLETPDLLVRLPERSTGPTSERIDGQTWSGVTRRYLISPMVPGEFSIPPQEVGVSWSAPSGGGPRDTTLTTEAFAFTGLVPEGAETLDPFFAAEALTLTSQVTGAPGEMLPGDSLTLTVTASVEGTSPMFLPPLLEVSALPGLKAYPDEPVLEEKDERGQLTGTRTETVTFVAEGGGSGALPEISLAWFNIASGAVETATAASVAYAIDGPLARTQTAQRDIRQIALWGAFACVVLCALFLAGRWALPRLRRRMTERRAQYVASEGFAWSELDRAVGTKDRAAFYPALDRWAAFHADNDPRQDPGVSAAVYALGRAAFGPAGEDHNKSAWSDLSASLRKVRRSHPKTQTVTELPPLNPTRTPA